MDADAIKALRPKPVDCLGQFVSRNMQERALKATCPTGSQELRAIRIECGSCSTNTARVLGQLTLGRAAQHAITPAGRDC